MGNDYAWTVQHARNIAQTFAFATIDLADPASVTAAERLRDQAMADNVLWWQQHTGHKMLLSAHNGHIGYLSTHPDMYPRTQGAVLRDHLGRGYAAIGFTFAAWAPSSPRTPPRRGLEAGHRPGGAPRHERTHPRPGPIPGLLPRPADRTRRGPHLARPRTAGLRQPSSTFTPDPLPTLALGRAYDVLIHLHHVRTADKT